MKQEYQTDRTICDGCGKIKETPGAITSTYKSGWETFEDLDMCPVCYGMVCIHVISHTPKETVEKILNKQPQHHGMLGGDYVYTLGTSV